MKPSLDQIEAALRAAVKEAAQLRRQNRLLREAAGEPIAIVGMACRYPGGVFSPAELWNLVDGGGDAISAFPADRGWDLEGIYDPDPERPATSNTREGGFLYDAGEFDPDFFGISPREAKGMDPQLRLMLEGTWEGLEHAGIDPIALRGTSTGVFAGVMYHDYGWGLPPTAESGWALATGGGSSIVSGHVAYTLGLEGPTLSVDTACSSSLVAMHLAAQSLRGGECSLALAGGVTVLAVPGIFIQFSRQGGVAPDGRCKAFAEAADGAGFSEGAGVLVLERLSDAEANGHRVLATIRGSAINQDGASNGLTAPNGPAQERVIRQALANAGLKPSDIDMVEAHGTGTTLGDPIEAGALLATYGQEREQPLRLGSLKSNIGHTQAAAGVGGVIKAVMAMREETMPKTLHVEQPSSRIEWQSGSIELLTEAVEWKANGHPRRAAVSSFGASGTNAHLILEEAPKGERAEDGAESIPAEGAGAEPRPHGVPAPLALSAKSEEALRAQAGRLASLLREDPPPDPYSVAYSLGTTRARLEQRAAIAGQGREQLLAGLDALTGGESHDCVARGRAGQDEKVAFLFPGLGSQWSGMVDGLLGDSPAFALAMDECEEALSPFLDWSPRDVLRQRDDGWLQRVELAQPIVFSMMVSLARLWRACGVEPAAVFGHSLGEIAAAHVAGGLTLDDAARLVVVRSQVISKLSGRGRLIAIALPADRLEAQIAPWQGRIEVAAINSPVSAALSGDGDCLDELLARCEEEGIWARGVPGAVTPSHSFLMEELREELLEEIAPISPRSGEIPFYSTVTGARIDTANLDAEYWYRNTRQPVLLEPVVRELLERGHRVLIEVSSHPVLVPAVQETIEAGPAGSRSATALGTLRRSDGGAERFARSLADAQAHGAPLDWRAFSAGVESRAEVVELPTYPFQRQRFWLNAPGGGAGLIDAGLANPDHPLLGAAIEDPEGEGIAFSGRISLETHPWLADHAAFETALLPGTAFVEMALRAGMEVEAPLLDELTLEVPLVIASEAPLLLRLTVAPPDDRGQRQVAFHSRSERAEGGGGTWTCHARGVLGPASLPGGVVEGSPASWADSWPPPAAEPVDVGSVYERLAEAGIDYGPAFQGLVAAWRDGAYLYAEVSVPGDQLDEARRFGIHPALFDAIGHAGVALSLQDRDVLAAGELPLPFAWKGVRLHAVGAASLRVRVSTAPGEQGLTALDETGAPVLSVESVVVRPVDRARLRAAAPGGRSLYRLEWKPLPASHAGEPGPTPMLEDYRSPEPGDPAEAGRALAARALERMQGFLAEAGEEDARLVFLTRGALATSGEEVPDLAVAAIGGLIRSAASEHPGRFCLIDSDGSEASEAALEQAFAADPGEPQLALRKGELLAPRLALARGPEDEQARPLDPERTVLITGATGGIGALLARHLVEAHGARRLLLASRSGEDAPGASELAARLAELGAEVQIAACDVSDRGRLEELLARVPSEHPLGAVIHCAAVLDDGLLESLDAERLARVFAPKADAAWHLHELTAGLGLTHFVCFSSIAGLLGGAAQANYAAANAFLDALAAHRRATGLPGSSMAWGGWEQRSSMTAGLEPDRLTRMMRQAAERLGLLPLSAEQGLALFDAALARPEALTVPAELDLALLRTRARTGALPALLKGLIRVPARAAGESGALARRLATVPEAERETLALELVRGHVAAVLGHDSPAEIAPEKAFKDLGFDSLAAVELRNRLAADSGVRLAATAVFDYPSSLALAQHLLSTVAGESARPVVSAGAAHDEPVAIVGMACRYPGGISSPSGLWGLVAGGGDATSAFPDDRGWDLERLYDPTPGTPGTSYANQGGFLYDAGEFDPDFFGISPREAIEMDPQQRLMLEISWEVLEHAGIDPRTLRSSPTGVFAGSMYQDYGEVAGMTSSAVSGRVSYTLGLEGPSISVDTACSSSLVAMHLAAQSLRGGECSLALAGGVAVLYPAVFVEFSRQRGLAPDGRCKAFAEGADGIGISDGVGVLVLERLSDAEANGHRVLATIRGSAINQDGASNGLTAPNGPAQERVIRQALANAGLKPSDIDMVEAHGTGTTLGDPIEAGALLATYGQEREQPLRLGSLKSNIGHTQAAAGVGGVIKAVMAMREETMPKTLHVEQPSSRIEWQSGSIELLTEAVEWKANGHPRRAAVSSFGASGTNAHLILEEAPKSERAGSASAGIEAGDGEASPLPGWAPLPLSARSEPALREAAGELANHLRGDPALAVDDVVRTLALHRTRFERRAIVAERERAGLLDALDAVARGEESPSVAAGLARVEQRPVFLFGGQGAQWAGMGVELIEASPRFAASMRACEEALAPHVEWSLREVLEQAEGEWLERLDVVQPALFAVMVSLADLWRACGVEPAAVIGHSQGEIAAAHVAGALSLEDAARVVALRARAMTAIAGQGGMLWVTQPLEQLSARLEPFEGRISLAAINGPTSLVVSGEPAALAELAAGCTQEGIQTRPVAVDYAAHSAQIDALEGELLEAFGPISPGPGEIPFYSTVSGGLLDGRELGPEYWFRNLRQTVRFDPVLRSLLERGSRAFVEIAPHPVLAYGATETIEDALGGEGDAAVFGALRREDGGASRFTLSLAEAHAHGVELDWEAILAGTGGEPVPLPTYPFQRQRFWLDATASGGDPRALGQEPLEHPLLGSALTTAAGELLVTGSISRRSLTWLDEDPVSGSALLPAASLLEMVFSTAGRAGWEGVESLQMEDPLVLPAQGEVQLQVSLAAADGSGARALAIHSRPAPIRADDGLGERDWTCNATAILSHSTVAVPGASAVWPPADAESVEVEALRRSLEERGAAWSAGFARIAAAWREGERLHAELVLADDPVEGAYVLQPALLQTALGIGALCDPAGPAPGEVELLASCGAASVRPLSGEALRVSAARGDDGDLVIDLSGPDGTPIAHLEGLRTKGVPPERLRAVEGEPPRPLRLSWPEVSLPASSGPGEEVEVADFRESGGGPTEAPANVVRALERLQEWIGEERPAGARLVFLTCGAVAAGDGESPDLGTAPLWGMLRSAAAELPGSIGLVDLDRSQRSDRALPSVLAATAGEPQLAVREGRAMAPRVAPVAATTGTEGPSPFDPQRTVLITGAGADLGALVARHLAETLGARNLLLACGGGEAAAAERLARALAPLGCTVRVERCDPADRPQLQDLLESIPADRPLGAVIHAARTFDDGVIAALDAKRLTATMSAGIDAAWNLHELTEPAGLSRFLLFSSSAGTLGTAARAGFGGVSGFLDALAAARRAAGLPATSLAWGWTEVGDEAEATSEAGRARLGRAGLAPISAERALGLFDAALALDDQPLLVPVELDAPRLRALASEGGLPSVLRGVVRAPASARAAEPTFAARLAAVAAEERGPLALELVRDEIATVLAHPSAGEVDPDRPFQELGFDSLAAVELRNRLGSATGLKLPPTLAFDYPTPAALAAHLAERCAAEGPEAAPEEALEAALAALDRALASVGESGAARERVGMRMRAALASLATAEGGEAEDLAGELAAMSNDEVFALIDEEVGDA